MNIKPFAVEEWMNAYEDGARYNIAETCVDSVSLDELFALCSEDRQAFLEHFCARRLTYGDIVGSEALREGVCGLYQSLTPSEVVPTHGAAGANYHVFCSLVSPGDGVVSIMPAYQQMYSIPEAIGADVRLMHLRQENGYLPDLAELRSLVDVNTKLICVNNPNNPTGALYPREVLQEIVDVARKHQLMIFSDEIYDRLVFDGEEHVSIASMAPDLFCVTFSGLSKSHMIAGYRIGWMIFSGNMSCAKDFLLGINMLSNMRLCSNVPAQSIVQTALGGHQSVNNYIVPGGRIYEQREYIYNALNSIDGITAVKPKAAFYIFPKIDVKKFNITNDEQFALDLLHQKKILITRGGGFNWGEPDHFRIVYLPRIEVLSEAMRDLEEFLSTYRQ